MSKEDKEQQRSEDNHHSLSRRAALKGGLILVGGIALEACAKETAAPEATTAPEATDVPTKAPTKVPTEVPPTATLEPGELVPDIEVMNLPFASWQEVFRQFVPEAEKLGLKFNVQTVEANTWIQKATSDHEFGDFTGTAFFLGGERIDPNWVLQNLLHSKSAVVGRQNMMEYKNPEMDAVIDAQEAELDPEKRRELVLEAQRIFVETIPFYNLIHLNEVAAYNKENWEGFIPMLGGGITRWNNYPSWVNIKSKTGATVFRVDNDHDGNSTNPFLASGGQFNKDTILWIYDTLARVDTDLTIMPWGAESWEWVDDLTLAVTLRSDMKFHDGVPVTAEDLAFTINYAMEHQFAEWASEVEPIESVTAVDELTVHIKLKRVVAPFVNTTFPAIYIVPKHIWENVTDPETFENPNPIGSGPCLFGHWRKNESWRFNRNPDHWMPMNFDVLVAIIPALETLFGQLETGELDASAGATLRGEAQLQYLKSLDYIEVVVTPRLGFYGMYPSFKRLPGSDLTFRRAIQHVIPRETMLAVLGAEAGGLPGSATWVHPEDPYYLADLPSVEYDIEKARQILAEGGYSWDDDGRLHYPSGLSA